MAKLRPECVAFGETVRVLRSSKGYSQEEFAARASVHRTYIGGIERGERNPTLSTICKIAIALDVAPGDLLGNVGAKT